MKNYYIIAVLALFVAACGNNMYRHEVTELRPNLIKKELNEVNISHPEMMKSNPYAGYVILEKETGKRFNGTIDAFNEDDQTIEYIFENGLLKHLNTYGEEGNLKYKMNYAEGKFFELYDNGKLKEEIDYNRYWTATYYENGRIKSESNNQYMFTYYPSGQLQKKYELFFEDEQDVKFNYFHGKFEMYYENGNLKAEGKYDHDKLDGELVYYSTNGEVVNREEYDEGLLLR